MKAPSPKFISLGLMMLTIGAVFLIWILDKKKIDNQYVATKIVSEAGPKTSVVEKLKSMLHEQIRWDATTMTFVDKNKQAFEGIYKTFYQNGQIKWLVPIKNGKVEGTVFVFGRKGIKRWEQAYKQGIPDGFWRKYDPFGALLLKGKFINGEKDSTWSLYYPDGSVRYNILFDHGKVMREQFFQNGKAK
jgi:antitoxin component YwqK of YwqJK toxin-antitoxin module